MIRHVPHAVGVCYEVDPLYLAQKAEPLNLGLPLEVQHADYAKALEDLTVPTGALLIVFIAPPWGTGLGTSDGLDLRHTTPLTHSCG